MTSRFLYSEKGEESSDDESKSPLSWEEVHGDQGDSEWSLVVRYEDDDEARQKQKVRELNYIVDYRFYDRNDFNRLPHYVKMDPYIIGQAIKRDKDVLSSVPSEFWMCFHNVLELVRYGSTWQGDFSDKLFKYVTIWIVWELYDEMLDNEKFIHKLFLRHPDMEAWIMEARLWKDMLERKFDIEQQDRREQRWQQGHQERMEQQEREYRQKYPRKRMEAEKEYEGEFVVEYEGAEAVPDPPKEIEGSVYEEGLSPEDRMEAEKVNERKILEDYIAVPPNTINRWGNQIDMDLLNDEARRCIKEFHELLKKFASPEQKAQSKYRDDLTHDLTMNKRFFEAVVMREDNVGFALLNESLFGVKWLKRALKRDYPKNYARMMKVRKERIKHERKMKK